MELLTSSPARVGASSAVQTGSVGIQLPATATVTTGVGVETAWVQLIASTDVVADWLLVSMTGSQNQSSSNESGMTIDIGVGAAASEIVVISDLVGAQVAYTSGTMGNVGPYLLPVPRIPAGSRLAGRAMHNGNSGLTDTRMRVHITPIAGPDGNRPVSTYGAANGLGTSVDPGGTANTKGSWTTIGSTTTRRHTQLWIVHRNTDGTQTDRVWLEDIAVGAASSEQIVIPDIGVQSWLAMGSNPTITGPWPVDISAGSRLSARLSCSIGTATVRKMDCVIYGA